MNIAQTNFLYWQNVRVWRLIKVNNKKFVVSSSACKFVVVPKTFTDYNDKI